MLHNFQKFSVLKRSGNHLPLRKPLSSLSSAVLDKKNQEKKETQEVKPFSAIPTTFQVPILGAVCFLGKELRENYVKFYQKCNEKYGDIVRFDFIGKPPIVVLFNPDSVMEVYRNEGKFPHISSFDSFAFYRKKMRPDLFPTLGGLIGEHGENWHLIRSQVQQDMLRPHSALFYIEPLESIALDLVKALKNNLNEKGEFKEIITERLFNMWAFESICMVFINKRMNCFKHNFDKQHTSSLSLSNETINAAIKVLKLSMNLVMASPTWKYFPKWVSWFQEMNKNYDILFRNLNLLVKTSIEEIQEQRKIHGNVAYKDKSLIEKFMDNSKNKDYTIPILMTIDGIFAGIETVSNTAMVLLYHLATNPSKQDILHNEIKKNIGPTENITDKHLSLMPYLKACLQESQRLVSIAPASTRTLSTSLVLCGYHVPAGTECISFFQVISNKESQFERANEFLPERWLNQRRHKCPSDKKAIAGAPIHPFSSLPFGHGPRMCIGRRFATLEIYLLTIKIIQSFRLEYHHEPMGIKTEFMLQLNKPLKLKMIQRNNIM